MKKDNRWKKTTDPRTIHAPSVSNFQKPEIAMIYTGITGVTFLYKYQGFFLRHVILSTSG